MLPGKHGLPAVRCLAEAPCPVAAGSTARRERRLPRGASCLPSSLRAEVSVEFLAAFRGAPAAQRLEFLGDAVLDALVTTHFYTAFRWVRVRWPAPGMHVRMHRSMPACPAGYGAACQRGAWRAVAEPACLPCLPHPSGASPSQMHDMRSVAVNASRLALAGERPAMHRLGSCGGCQSAGWQRSVQPGGACEPRAWLAPAGHQTCAATCAHPALLSHAAVKHGLHTHVRHQSPRLFSHITGESHL